MLKLDNFSEQDIESNPASVGYIVVFIMYIRESFYSMPPFINHALCHYIANMSAAAKYCQPRLDKAAYNLTRQKHVLKEVSQQPKGIWVANVCTPSF